MKKYKATEPQKLPYFISGPWKITSDLQGLFIETVGSLLCFSKQTIAKVDYIGPIKTRTATANLIAAAPDLYEALEKIKQAMFGIDELTITEKHILSVAESALKKARGEKRWNSK